MPLIEVFYTFLTLEIPPGETLAFILHVIFDCFLSLSLPCLILPHVSARSPKSISCLLHPGQTVVGIDYHTACSVASLTCHSPIGFTAFLTSSEMLCRWALGCFCSWPVPHSHSNIVTCRCQTHWKVKSAMQRGWLSEGLGLVTQKTASCKEQN